MPDSVTREDINKQLTALAESLPAGENKSRLQALITDYANGQLRLMIMGSFSVGKSSFINVLLGREVAAVNDRPTTAMITIFKYGEQESIKGVYKDGAERVYTPEQFAEITALRSDGTNAEREKIHHVEWQMPAPLLREYTIIDSPGLNATTEADSDITLEYVSEAEAVVWMLSADNAGTAEEARLIRSLPSRLKPLVVVNKIEEAGDVDDDDDEAGAEELLAEISNKLGDSVLDVIGVSARCAKIGQDKGDSESVKLGNVAGFLKSVKLNIGSRLEYMKFNNLAEKFDVLLADIYAVKEKADAKTKRNMDKDYAGYIANWQQGLAIEQALAALLGLLYEARDSLTDDGEVYMRLKELKAKAKQHSRNHLAAKQKVGYAAMKLGLLLYPDNQAEALRYMQLAIDYNVAWCGDRAEISYLLGKAYLQTEAKKSYPLLCAAAENGKEEAWLDVANCLYVGIGTKMDRLSAFLICYTKGLLDKRNFAAKFKSESQISLQLDIAIAFESGKGTFRGMCFPKNNAAAKNWYRIAYQNGSARAAYWYGDILLSENSIEHAYDWFLLAHRAGEEAAKDQLENISNRWIKEAADKGDYEKVVELHWDWLDLFPDDKAAWSRLGDATLQEEYGNYRLRAARYYWRAGDHKGAAQTVLKSVAILALKIVLFIAIILGGLYGFVTMLVNLATR